MASELNTLEDLLIEQLQDLYDAEKRLVKALPKMVEAVHSPPLQEAFRNHLEETKHQVKRLEEVFGEIGQPPRSKACDAMKELVAEGQQAIDAQGSDEVRDAALIAAAQRIEHYEMAGYGTARAFAEQLGFSNAAQWLQETLNEEAAADRTLTEVAQQKVNVAAQHV